MNKYILLFRFLLAGSLGFSQNYVDVLKVSASTSPNNTFDSSSTKTKLNELMVDLTVPVKINEGFSVLTGVIYEDIQTKLFADGIVKNFGSTSVKLGFNKQLTEKWSTTVVALPKIASDYNSFNSRDFQMGGIALFKYKKRDNLNFKTGLYYNSELFGPFFVPMLGMYYQSPNKKFEANIMLPLHADINYQVLKFMNVGVNFNGQIRSYHLNNVTDANPNTYVAKSTNELFAYLKFNITKNISLQTKVGQSFARSFKVYDTNDQVNFGLPLTFVGNKRDQLNSNFSNGLIFQATLVYRISLEK
ncbi:MAG TPA: DUF6268 family outer membrane beta-barrel protein [Bacteroidia bacterium]|nr:DUF6268 family outer membrane beta-barrel protein [Bacteroidia bacterium]